MPIEPVHRLALVETDRFVSRFPLVATSGGRPRVAMSSAARDSRAVTVQGMDCRAQSPHRSQRRCCKVRSRLSQNYRARRGTKQSALRFDHIQAVPFHIWTSTAERFVFSMFQLPQPLHLRLRVLRASSINPPRPFTATTLRPRKCETLRPRAAWRDWRQRPGYPEFRGVVRKWDTHWLRMKRALLDH